MKRVLIALAMRNTTIRTLVALSLLFRREVGTGN